METSSNSEGGQRRQDRWQSCCQHGFAGPSRAHHQEMMATGSSNFQCAFGAFLPFDVAKIEQVGLLLRDFRLGARKNLCALEMVGELDQR